ncbi:MAG: hypothetical protein M0R17_06050 [Candidatus Omnitrophica bacterium]|jgi:hypothetical protein|nr:hypothetical protein [Candidatus Omnitrophota bacterium]
MKKILFLTLVLGIFLINLIQAGTVETDSLGATFDTFTPESSGGTGIYINVTRDIGINVKSYNISSNTSSDKCYLYDMSNNTLYTGFLSATNCYFLKYPRLEYGTQAFLFVNKTSGYTRAQVTPFAYPITGTNIDFIRGHYNGINYTDYAFILDTVFSYFGDTIDSNINSTSQIFNLSSFESYEETFKINISSDGVYSVNATLFYNNTNYGYGTKIGNETFMEFTKKITIPLTEITAKNFTNLFYWNVSYGNSSAILNYGNQVVKRFLFSLCNTTTNNRFLNLSFKDESTNIFINASLPSANFVYWLNNKNYNKTYILINNSYNYKYDFCSLVNTTINTKVNIQYESLDYPQRIYQDTLSLSNVTTNKTLYLLSSTDGIYVTFQLINGNTEQVLNGVSVIGTRSIGGESTTIAIGTTDSAGSVTFWLNPDFEHTFNFSKSGYDTYTTTIYPTQTSYTISMTSGTTTTSIDYTKGISYQLSPSGGAKIASLMNMTTYNFTYSLASTYWDVSQFGFSLYYGNNSLVGSVYANTNGGDIGLMANTLNSSNMIMKYYYVINSTYYNGTRTWFVERGAYEFSILHFFEDLTLYMDNGMFGIDDLARVFFCLLIITMVTGGVIMRYGINNEAAIMGILFGLVYFLDIGVGLLPQVRFGNVAIEHFITIATALLLIGFLLKEESR